MKYYRETSRQTCGPICLATGTILLRNSAWTRALLRAWCAFSKVLSGARSQTYGEASADVHQVSFAPIVGLFWHCREYW